MMTEHDLTTADQFIFSVPVTTALYYQIRGEEEKNIIDMEILCCYSSFKPRLW
jgi:hypothetical protein